MRKLAAQYIFPVDAEPIRHGIVTVDDDGTILALSQSSELLDESESVEFYNGIIVPGFVNAHCHLELSHMLSTIPSGGGMAGFCEGIFKNRNHVDEKAQQDDAILFAQSMYNEGIVAVGDISNSTNSFAAKKQSPVYFHTFVECLGLKAEDADAIIKSGLNVLKQAEALGLSASITPHAPYSMSEKLFAETVKIANSQGILSIHNQESADEMELFANGRSPLSEAFAKYGFGKDPDVANYKNPIDRILKYVSATINLLLIHNVYTTAADYERTIQVNPNTTWVLCPKSNQYIENRLPPVDMFYNKGAGVALGTDSLSSNTTLSIIEEVKMLNVNFPHIPLSTLLYWATMGGAKALKQQNHLGSLSVGKKPGIVLIEGVDFERMQLTGKAGARNLLL